MATLYVISLEPYAGKTALCLGLGLELKARGLSIGYMKPLGTLPTEVGGQLTDEDVVFVLRTLGVDEPYNLACPVLLTPDVLEEPIRGTVVDRSDVVSNAFAHLSKGNEVLVMEGGAKLSDGYSLGIPQSHLAQITNASVLVVVKYAPGLAMDDILMARASMGERLVGVIVNSTPPESVPFVKERFPAFLQRYGMQLFGVMPMDKLLMAITVRDLARLLDGEILCAGDKLDDLVENFSIGAMNVDTALKYFLRTPNKAVITGGDRADIQLAALQTSTKCIILTGNLYPDAIILGRAAELGVPTILVRYDTMTTVGSVERALGHIRLSSQRQIDRLLEMIRAEIDLSALQKALDTGGVS
ncbi:MAG: phosphotransacetylase family protein [Chloroflexi bacterium]|nr:phosphotransacetylase family protein [Chloroflexota bacterium]